MSITKDKQNTVLVCLRQYISSLSINYHLNGYDTNCFSLFTYPTESSIIRLQISSWMTAILLNLNSSKTEFVPIARKAAARTLSLGRL